jgi:rhodanese-related sulfurtransferase
LTPEQLPLEVGPEDLAIWRTEPAPPVILDVREAWELQVCAFPDAIHMPLGELPGRERELPTDRRVVVVCHTGQRSLLATRLLRARGLRLATNLRGGVEAWALEVDPTMARY